MMRGYRAAMADRRIVSMAFGITLGWVSAAGADPTTYVDPAGVCNGLTPCFTTIQAGVNSVNDPDGADSGAFGVVFVFPGTYDESVDISGINGGTNTGDLSLVTVDSNGVVTPGTVTIQTAAGPAFRNSMAPYLGRFQIGGFTIRVTGFDGLLVNVRDDVEIHNSTSNETTVGSGFNVTTTEGHLVVAHSQAIDNAADGVTATIADTLTLTNSSFSLNNLQGVTANLPNPVQVTISGCAANQNDMHGFSFGTASDVDIIMSRAEANMGIGFSFSVDGPVLLSETTAPGNGIDGVNFGTAASVDIVQSHAGGNMRLGFSFGVDGPVLISESTANNNGTDGFNFGTATDVDVLMSHAGGNMGQGFSFGVDGPVLISESTANTNGIDGFNFGSATDVDVLMSQASANTRQGFSFGVNGPVLVSDCAANGNGADGFNFGTATDVEISSTHSGGNSGRGFSFGVTGPVVISDCTGNGNSDDGFNFGSATDVDILMSHAAGNASRGFSFSVNGPALISESTANGNTIDGFNFGTAMDLDITNSQANENGNRGFSFAANGPVLISETTSNNNGFFGFTLDTMTDVTFMACQANGNVVGDGISFNLVEGPVTIVETTANNNGTFGVFVEDFVSRADVSGSQALENGSDGFLILAEGPVSISTTRASMNGGWGINVTALAAVTVDQTGANANGQSGLLIRSETDTTVTDCVANRNDESGFVLGISKSFANDVFVTDCTANGNGRFGFLVGGLQFNQAVLERVTAFENARLDPGGAGMRVSAKGFVESFILRDSWIQGNAGNGIELANLNPKTALTHEISGSIICDNLGAGVEVPLIQAVGLRNIPLELPAFGNWWGDASGPTHPSNPGGTGDEIIDGASGGDGIVHFDPWIDTITATASPTVVSVGDPVNIEFQFSDAAMTRFLGPAPGNLLSDVLPFDVSTDNGEVSGTTGAGASITEPINQPNGIVAVTLIPDTAGTATVTLDGPCGLDALVTIEAIAADFSVTKTDDADPVMLGDTVTYTIAVTNNGPDDATSVTLTDTLPAGVGFVSATPTQGSCAEAAGVVTCTLGGLSNGASVTVEVAVVMMTTGTITNTASVSGKPNDPNPSNNTDDETTIVIAPEEPEDPEPQEPPASQPTSQPAPDCGIGLCGRGTIGFVPWMTLGLGFMHRGVRRRLHSYMGET